jgi:hypothetical protein
MGGIVQRLRDGDRIRAASRISRTASSYTVRERSLGEPSGIWVSPGLDHSAFAADIPDSPEIRREPIATQPVIKAL